MYCGFVKCMKAILVVMDPTYVVAAVGLYSNRGNNDL